MARQFRKRNKTPAEQAKENAVRERFQREKPSPQQLTQSGEYDSMRMIDYLKLMQAKSSQKSHPQ
jgi:hypothetical protein